MGELSLAYGQWLVVTLADDRPRKKVKGKLKKLKIDFKNIFIRINVSLTKDPNPSTENLSMAFVDLSLTVQDQNLSIRDFGTAFMHSGSNVGALGIEHEH